jgi:hypothetical protein
MLPPGMGGRLMLEAPKNTIEVVMTKYLKMRIGLSLVRQPYLLLP